MVKSNLGWGSESREEVSSLVDESTTITSKGLNDCKLMLSRHSHRWLALLRVAITMLILELFFCSGVIEDTAVNRVKLGDQLTLDFSYREASGGRQGGRRIYAAETARYVLLGGRGDLSTPAIRGSLPGAQVEKPTAVFINDKLIKREPPVRVLAGRSLQISRRKASRAWSCTGSSCGVMSNCNSVPCNEARVVGKAASICPDHCLSIFE